MYSGGCQDHKDVFVLSGKPRARVGQDLGICQMVASITHVTMAGVASVVVAAVTRRNG